VTSLPLDVHLMIEEPDRYVDAFVEAGAAMVTVHVEAARHLHRTVSRIRQLGAKAGVALNPATPLETLDEIASDVDHVLIMSVNPGFGGQSFIARSIDKIAATRRLLGDAGGAAAIEVDGGVDAGNAGALVRAGASILVAGVSIFRTDDPAAATRALRTAGEAH
jgi:ribulose-phosphate 3-epimerase